jgi:hypothetical protein
MTPAMTEPSAAHRAALALHALADLDRAWVLDGLSTEQRDRLHPLLRELEELGIPRDEGLLATLAPAEAETRARTRHALEDLTPVQVRSLAQLLAAEPPRLVAALLASRPWPWRGPLLACLPGEVAREVEQLANAVLPAGALQAALIAQVEKTLIASGAPAVAAGRWAGLRSRLVALRRNR